MVKRNTGILDMESITLSLSIGSATMFTLQKPINKLVAKDARVLAIGCGNAVFSADMFNDGYIGLVNVDISPVVIEQQRERYPDMCWEVMDCLKSPAIVETYEAVVDKSLIDTIMCASNSSAMVTKLVQNMYKILKPGGVYITLSLHKEDDVIDYFYKEGLDWKVYTYNILNPRWDTEKGSKRSVSHCLVVCKKPRQGEDLATMEKFPELDGVLGEAELQHLQEKADAANIDRIFKIAPTEILMECLNNALAVYLQLPDAATTI